MQLTRQKFEDELKRLESLQYDSFPMSGDEQKWDDRVIRVNLAVANLIGVNVGYLEWVPNETPASMDERLAWIWLRWPENCSVVKDLIRDPFLREQIEGYDHGRS